MRLPVAVDITRLATRVLNLTPNGIDRLDFAFASHFLSPARQSSQAFMMTQLGPRAIAANMGRSIVEGIAIHWGEDETPDSDEAYQKVAAWIRGEAAPSAFVQRIVRKRPERAAGLLRWIGKNGLPVGRNPVKALPEGARYVNVSQFPVWMTRYFQWLSQRPDVKAVFFVHDLLPLEFPEYFRPNEYERHLRRLNNIARFGAGAIVTTEAVRQSLLRHLAALGRAGMPVLVAPAPVAPVFHRRGRADKALGRHPYFVSCGTIEPRKNHLMLLHIWRELVRRDGASAPKLVLIGSRGWENENAIDLLERCPAIGNHVIEVSGLPTPSVKRLLDGASALLMPSFAEGYGLPVAEALAAGVPVVASDLPVVRETGRGRVTTLSPIDGERWLETVRALAASCPPAKDGAEARAHDAGSSPARYFAKIESFLESL
ncbi:MAG TPA: glycosyltransferase family 1 protein [Methylocella sp.]|nr:glycosyltransferase family 1 protein [Methylocella sp.]